MREMNTVDWVAFVLVAIGGINWGLVGIFKYNLVSSLFGAGSDISRVIYAVVGLATVYLVTAVLIPRSASRAL